MVARRKAPAMNLKKRYPMMRTRRRALLASGDFLRRDLEGRYDEQKAFGRWLFSPAKKLFGLKVPNGSTSRKTIRLNSQACVGQRQHTRQCGAVTLFTAFPSFEGCAGARV